MIDALLLAAKEHARDGILNGTLQIVGSVVRFTSGERKGQIHSHLQPTAAAEFAQQSALKLDNLQNGQEAMQATLGSISGSVQALQVMGGLNLVLSVVDIGISIAGFALMNAKLNAVQSAIQEVSDNIQFIQQDAIERDFTKLRALAERYENTWHIVDYNRASPILLEIANNANETQLLLESHAKKLLLGGVEMLPIADRMLDGMALTLGLRVSAAMATNESSLARHIADEGARKIEAITGTIGQVDLVRAKIPKQIDPTSKEWCTAIAKAQEETAPMIAKLRLREENAATRSSPLSVLERRGIAPREWLAAARAEQRAPILFLPE